MAENTLGKSFVRLDAILKGTDSPDIDIIRAARVSTGRHLDDVTEEKLKGMINFLYRDHHLTPFQKIVFRFHIKATIRAARPFFCVLFSSHNEFSGRYSVFPENDFYVPSSLPPNAADCFRGSQNYRYRQYQNLLSLGVAKEQARFILPYCFFTQFYWTVDLRTLFEFLDETETNPQCGTEDFRILLEQLKECVESVPVAHEAYRQWRESPDREWVEELKKLSGELKGALKDEVKPQKKGVQENLLGGSARLIEVGGGFFDVADSLNDRLSPKRALDQIITRWELDVPIFVWRQLVRHRKGYPVEIGDDFKGAVENRRLYLPDKFRCQKGKVGHYVFEDLPEQESGKAGEIFRKTYEISLGEVIHLRREKVPPADAVLMLPYAFYTRVRWVVPLSSLFNIFLLRLDGHAQWETRQFVRAMYRLFKSEQPLMAKIFEKYFWPKFWRGKSFSEIDD